MRRVKLLTSTRMNPGISIGLVLTLAMLLGMTGIARALGSFTTTGILYTGNGFNDGNYAVTIAMEFVPVADITVTELGVFDGGSDGPGLQTAHDVGLWASDGTLLAMNTIDNNATLKNGFRFTKINPVILNAGENYILGAYYPAGMAGDKLVATSLTPAPLAGLYSLSRLVGGSVLTFPDGSGSITNPDFRITANLIFSVDMDMVPMPWLPLLLE